MQPEPPPPEVEVVVVAADDGSVLVGSAVRFGDRTTGTDEFGLAAAPWSEPVTVVASAPGFEPAATDVAVLPGDPIELRLEPIRLRGAVTTVDGEPLPLAHVSLGDVEAVTDADGEFEVVRAVAGEVAVSKPAWLEAAAEWDGDAARITVVLEPLTVRALRVSAQAVADSAQWSQLLGLTDGSTVNGLVIDVKDESGTVMYLSKVPEAEEIGAISVLYDVDQVLAQVRDRDLYAVARVVAFQDTRMATAHPEWAARDSADGEPFRDAQGNAWLDPSDRAAWEYPLAIAAESCTLGFDEVQFDYVRYPSDGPTARLTVDGGNTSRDRVESVAGFLAEARARLNPLGCAVSASVLGIIASVDSEQGVGQRFEELSAAVDVISPQVYPSLFGPGWLNLDDPGDYPAEVVGFALDTGLPRLEGAALLRPWLQANDYGATEISIEINEAEDRGLGWMLWNAAATFSRAALPAAD